MRKIRLFIASSLDGYIATTSGDVDWLFTDQDYGYTEFSDQIDTVLMGNKTYQQILEFGDYPYKDKKGYVFSKTLQGKDENVEFVVGDLKDFINTLRQASGGDIWLVGGGQIIDYFLKYHFIDELILAIHPIILGDGIPLFNKDVNLQTKLELQAIKSYDSGLVQIYYIIKNS